MKIFLCTYTKSSVGQVLTTESHKRSSSDVEQYVSVSSLARNQSNENHTQQLTVKTFVVVFMLIQKILFLPLCYAQFYFFMSDCQDVLKCLVLQWV